MPRDALLSDEAGPVVPTATGDIAALVSAGEDGSEAATRGGVDRFEAAVEDAERSGVTGENGRRVGAGGVHETAPNPEARA